MVQFAPDFRYGSYTQRQIANIIPMFPLSLDGLDRAVSHLMSKNGCSFHFSIVDTVSASFTFEEE